MTPPRSITTRSALLLMLLAIVFLISASILVVVDYGARRTIRDLSQRYSEQSADRIQSEMGHFFGRSKSFSMSPGRGGRPACSTMTAAPTCNA